MSGPSRLYATYLIETPYSLEHAAEMIATEQSTGTFVAVPGETEQVREKHRARIEQLEETGQNMIPSLPGSSAPRGVGNVIYHQGKVRVSFPLHNFGASVSNLLATVAGNLFELKELSGIRLLDLDFPEEFSTKYPGPQFGIEGTRRICNVYGRPVIGTIIKPSIGLSSDDLRLLVRELAHSGIDFVKDDELNANPPYFPLEDKVRIVMEEVNRAADKTGKKLMYAFNITGEIDEMIQHHDLVLEAGGNCVMVSINSVGWAAVSYLRKHSQVPIHGHRNQWGALTRAPMLGMEFSAYQKLCRLVGVDHLHTNGMNNKFYESNESVLKSVRDCLTPMFGGYTVMPVLSSGQWAGSAIPSYQEMKTTDVIHLAGGGIMAHPAGITAGVFSMKQGWEAALQGVSLAEYASTHQELKQAVDKFSNRA